MRSSVVVRRLQLLMSALTYICVSCVAEPLLMSQLVNLLGKCLRDESTVCRMACSAVKVVTSLTSCSSNETNLSHSLLARVL